MSSQRILHICLACVFSLLLIFNGCSIFGPQKPPPVQPPPDQQPENFPPVIIDLKADAPQVQPLGKTQVICQARDANSDNLTYRWTATGGSIDGSGSTVTWTAPEKGGDYTIRVTVSDGNGGVSSRDANINVPEKPNNPPVITAISFTRPKRSPITVKTNPTDAEKKKTPELVILKYETADISCLASDSDNDSLDYKWMASGGKLIGKGGNIQWIAAGEAGQYTIVVEVSDNKGGTATFNILVNVHCCSG